MEGLQRSEVSFRRQGSSGLVWDDKLLSGELKKISQKDQTEHKDEEPKVKPISTGYRAGKVEEAFDPPSPRMSTCCICGGPKKPSPPARKGRKTAAPGRRTR